jgi:hypothetical protein
MSNVIDFLERIGTDPRLLHASPDEMQTALVRADIAAPLRSAILGKDHVQLEALLEAPKNVCCMIEAIDMNDHGPVTYRESLHSLGANRDATTV